jgi:hypothetical protein
LNIAKGAKKSNKKIVHYINLKCPTKAHRKTHGKNVYQKHTEKRTAKTYIKNAQQNAQQKRTAKTHIKNARGDSILLQLQIQVLCQTG